MPLTAALLAIALAVPVLQDKSIVVPPPRDPRNVPTVNLDPEHPFPIEGWWSNGEQLLEVANDGAYRIFGTQNRYQRPLEVGRWHRQNYGAFWLAPYSMRKEDRSRVPLAIADGTVVATVRTYRPMRHLEAPPACTEDLFIGLWAGPGGSLELAPTMRYRYAAASGPNESQPVVIARHSGTWRVVEGDVELLPDSPSVAKVRFEAESVEPGRGFTTLRGIEGTLDRIAELAPGTPGAPPPAAPPPAAAPAPEAAPASKPTGL